MRTTLNEQKSGMKKFEHQMKDKRGNYTVSIYKNVIYIMYSVLFLLQSKVNKDVLDILNGAVI